VRGLALAAIVLGCITTAAAGDDTGGYARGSLAWFSTDRYDLLGTMSVELPLASPGGWRVFAGATLLTAIEKATDFTFVVGQVDYTLAVGARLGAFEVFVAEQGFERVDEAGTARVRVAGGAWESPGFRDGFPRDGWAGRASLAAVWESKHVDADAVAAGSVRWMRRVGASRGIALGVDAGVDALLGPDHGADVLAGPRVDFDLGGDRRFGLFVRWLESDNPLGLGVDGLLAGFDLGQGPLVAGRLVPPEISGHVAAGGGDGGRPLCGLDLRVDSPAFLRGFYGEIEVDANVNGDDLFYLYDVGLAHPFAKDWRAGGFFHHRSNHLLNQANATVTSINVLEAAVETAGWRRAEPGVALGRLGAIDLSVRAGWLVDSAFGEDTPWHARGGVRWSTPPWGPVRAYLSAAAERGDVEASAYALGMLLPRGWDVRVEALHDRQLFATDQRGIYGIATLRY